MKLMIEIDEEDYHRIASGFGQEEDALLLEKIFKNGTPIPDNASNGDIYQIRAELYEDYESYSASEVNFEFACGIKRAIDTIDYHINHNLAVGSQFKKDRRNCEYRHDNGNCLKVGGFCMSVDDEHCVKGGK
jgi:hypothetical protein